MEKYLDGETRTIDDMSIVYFGASDCKVEEINQRLLQPLSYPGDSIVIFTFSLTLTLTLSITQAQVFDC
ncbi:hypothetical protein LguiA_018896 [Lonicera macranthoides]